MVTSTWVRMSAIGLRDLRVAYSVHAKCLESLKLYKTVALMDHFSVAIKIPYLFTSN